VRRSQAGLTLIEVMVAVTLLGLLSVGIITALQIGAGSWLGTRERLTHDRRISSANQIFHSAFSGIVPMTAQPIPEGEARFPTTVFFQGEPQTMRFVSAYSVTAGNRGGLNIFELQVVDSENGRRVLLNQFPYGGPYQAGELIQGVEPAPDGSGRRLLFQPVEPRGNSLIVADGLTGCEFRYLRQPRRPGEPAEWSEVWTDPRVLPLAVSVLLTPVAEPGRLLPVSITAPIPAWEPSPFKFMARGGQ
jgi:prepilin-type N-terminal cleavage/methylation domain-containing protein